MTHHHGLGGLRSPSLQYSPISSVATSWAGSSQTSDLHLQSPISNVVILGRIQSDLRTPISISNLQSPISIRGPGGGGGLKPSRRCAMDSFTMQKDLHPLFAPFCAISSRPTRSLGALWRKVRISTSVARSQAIARTNSRSQTPLEHLHRRRFASTNSSIYCCSWQEICHFEISKRHLRSTVQGSSDVAQRCPCMTVCRRRS